MALKIDFSFHWLSHWRFPLPLKYFSAATENTIATEFEKLDSQLWLELQPKTVWFLENSFVYDSQDFSQKYKMTRVRTVGIKFDFYCHFSGAFKPFGNEGFCIVHFISLRALEMLRLTFLADINFFPIEFETIRKVNFRKNSIKVLFQFQNDAFKK